MTSDTSNVMRILHDTTSQQCNVVLGKQAEKTILWLQNFLDDAKRRVLGRQDDKEVNILVPRTPAAARNRKRRRVHIDNDSNPEMSELGPTREGSVIKSAASTSDEVPKPTVSFARSIQCAGSAKTTMHMETQQAESRPPSRQSGRSASCRGSNGRQRQISTAGVFHRDSMNSRHTRSLTRVEDSSVNNHDVQPVGDATVDRSERSSLTVVGQISPDHSLVQAKSYRRSRTKSPLQVPAQQASPCTPLACPTGNKSSYGEGLTNSKTVRNRSPSLFGQSPPLAAEPGDEAQFDGVNTPRLLNSSSVASSSSVEMLVNEQTFTVDETDNCQTCADGPSTETSSCAEEEKDQDENKSASATKCVTPPQPVVKAKRVSTSTRVLRSASHSSRKLSPPLRLATTLLPQGRFVCTPVERAAPKADCEDLTSKQGNQEPKVLTKLANLATCKSFIRQPTPKKVDSKARQAQLKEAVEHKKKQAEERQRQQEERRQLELEEKKQKREERQRQALKRKAEMDEERAAKLRKRQVNPAPKQKAKEETATRRPDQQRKLQQEVKQRLDEEQKHRQARERLAHLNMSSHSAFNTERDNRVVHSSATLTKKVTPTVSSCSSSGTSSLASPPLLGSVPAKSLTPVLKEVSVNVMKVQASQPTKPTFTKGRFFSPPHIAHLSKPVVSTTSLLKGTSGLSAPVTSAKLNKPLSTMEVSKPLPASSCSISQTPPRPFIGHPVASTLNRSASASNVMSPPPVPAMPTPGRTATYENYDISNLTESESTDDEDSPRRAIPPWARNGPIKAACWNQDRYGPIGEEVFPPSDIETPNLMRIFSNKPRSRYAEHRGSSACWNSPMVKHLRMT